MNAFKLFTECSMLVSPKQFLILPPKDKLNNGHAGNNVIL